MFRILLLLWPKYPPLLLHVPTIDCAGPPPSGAGIKLSMRYRNIWRWPLLGPSLKSSQLLCLCWLVAFAFKDSHYTQHHRQLFTVMVLLRILWNFTKFSLQLYSRHYHSSGRRVLAWRGEERSQSTFCILWTVCKVVTLKGPWKVCRLSKSFRMFFFLGNFLHGLKNIKIYKCM